MYLRNLNRLKNKMLAQIELKLDKRSKTTSQTCKLSMIPIHLVEYDMKKDQKFTIGQTNTTKNGNHCLGKVLVGGCPPHIRFILRSQQVRAIEDFAKRSRTIDKTNQKIRTASTSIIDKVKN